MSLVGGIGTSQSRSAACWGLVRRTSGCQMRTWSKPECLEFYQPQPPPRGRPSMLAGRRLGLIYLPEQGSCSPTLDKLTVWSDYWERDLWMWPTRTSGTNGGKGVGRGRVGAAIDGVELRGRRLVPGIWQLPGFDVIVARGSSHYRCRRKRRKERGEEHRDSDRGKVRNPKSGGGTSARCNSQRAREQTSGCGRAYTRLISANQTCRAG